MIFYMIYDIYAVSEKAEEMMGFLKRIFLDVGVLG